MWLVSSGDRLAILLSALDRLRGARVTLRACQRLPCIPARLFQGRLFYQDALPFVRPRDELKRTTTAERPIYSEGRRVKAMSPERKVV